MIESVRIENLRSLKDTGFIDLKKINILLGANSSGKSTFLRSFPLFTQSVKKNLRGPISWFDDSYVDFGDYQTAKNKYVSKDEYIRFSYNIHEPFSDMFYCRKKGRWRSCFFQTGTHRTFRAALLYLQVPVYADGCRRRRTGTL